MKSRKAQLMRALLNGRQLFMASMLQIENTIRSLLRTQGLKLGRVHRCAFSEKVLALCADQPICCRSSIRCCGRVINSATRCVA